VDVPLTARLLSNGAPVSGKSINFQVLLGSGTPSPATATTDANGYARSTLHLSSLNADVQGSACLAPANNPCQTFYVVSVAPSLLKLENVSGSNQAVTVGQAFQAVTVRATDSSVPSNPVLGAPVSIQQTMFLPNNEEAIETQGDASSSHNAMKVILGASQQTIISDANGLVFFAPYNANLYRPTEIVATAAAGTTAILPFDFEQLPLLSPSAGASTGKARAPVGVSRAVSATPNRAKSVSPKSALKADPFDAPALAAHTFGAPAAERLPNRTSFEVDLYPHQDCDADQEDVSLQNSRPQSDCDSKTATSSSTDPPNR
jgi:hypothetical protein